MASSRRTYLRPNGVCAVFHAPDSGFGVVAVELNDPNRVLFNAEAIGVVELDALCQMGVPDVTRPEWMWDVLRLSDLEDDEIGLTFLYGVKCMYQKLARRFDEH
jgi:hypothetical protein